MVVLSAVVVGLGWYVEDVHRTQRASLLAGFEERARLTAELTGGALDGASADDTSEIERTFGGDRAGLSARLARYDRKYGIRTGLIADARGRILASHPPGLRAADLRGLSAGDMLARSAGRNRIGDLADPLKGVDGELYVATTFHSRDGLRMLISSSPVQEIAAFASSYLAAAPAVRGAQAVLVDGSGYVMSGDGRVGERPRRFGAGWQLARAPVRSTRWQVIFAAPEDQLFAPAEGAGRHLSIALFFALVLALLASGMLARRVVRRSAEVVQARTLAHERLHDPLTGLPNRGLFLDRLTNAIDAQPRSGAVLAVLFVDLDRFKRINDSLGHTAGDVVLRETAARLRAAGRAGDTVSRFGGDEFLVLCQIADEADALSIADRLHESIRVPMRVYGRDLKVTASIGVTLLSQGHDRDADAIVRDADAAMYHAKRQALGGSQIFDAGLSCRALERLDIEVGLASAVESEELILHYQPMVDPASGRICTLEALLRWDRGGHGFMSPGDFIPVAEDSGMIVPIGEWVLRRACSDLAGLRARGEVADDVRVSVNLSAVQLMDGGIVPAVAEALEESGLPASCLWLEVTETAVMTDLDHAVETLHALRELGVALAMDDFGTGQSSLSHVARLLPVDVLKLDRSFVLGMENPREHAIVAAVATIGRALGLITVAEGVETGAVAEALTAVGYDLGQGFHWHRPAGLESFVAQLASEAEARQPA